MSTPLLELDNLHFCYGSRTVLSGVSLTLAEGKVSAILGTSGCGKTTLLRLIGGQLRPTAGRIWFREHEITGATPERICQLGIGRTFQKNTVFRSLSVRENARLAVQAKRGPLFDPLRPTHANRELMARADEVLEMVGLTDGFDRPVGKLSYGEQRQLEIALALATEPELLLLDEPTAGMSPAETAAMVNLVEKLPRSLAMLMIEHDMTVVFSIADRITVLYYGEILASGTPEEISGNAKVQEVYLGIKH